MAEFRIGQRRFRTKGEAEARVKAVLHGHPIGTELSGEEFDLLRDLLNLHEEAADKIGPGVAVIRIAGPMPRTKHRRFQLVQTDGTPMDFSYPACFKPRPIRSQVLNVMRFEIVDKTTAYFESRVENGTFFSDKSGVPLQRNNTAVSYFNGPSFNEIGEEFASAEGGWDKIALTSSAEYGVGAFVDRDQAERWRTHWDQRAVLGLLTQEENRTR